MDVLHKTFMGNLHVETEVNYTLVGTFVIALIAAIVVLITWLSSGFSTRHYHLYWVIMNESVAGITTNSTVKYNGVEVGSVLAISLSKEHPDQVRLLLKVEENTPINAGTTATLTSQGLTGITYIALQYDPKNQGPLVKQPGELYPIIHSKPSLLARLDGTLQNLTTDMNQITQNIQNVLGGENPKLFHSILRNLDGTTQHLAVQSKQLDRLLSQTLQSTRFFPSLMETLTQQTLPASNQLLTNLGTLSNHLLEFSEELTRNPALLLRGQTALPPGPGEK